MKRHLVAVVVILVSLVLDQVSKWAAMTWMKGEPDLSYLGGIFVIRYAENPGGMLSLGAKLPDHARFLIFTVLVSLISIAILYHLFRSRIGTMERVAWALIFSGAIGNLVDRIRFEGYVVDFLNVGIGSLRTGIFNVADMAVMLGLLLFFISTLGTKHTH
ncbi:signal peptidase II [Gynuella sunshinyii]|uniref:Lipoprotein signal peptidase n=1 Tax=Gynuella sunshinyii YC6258 TaxID=1445510 RepID=A0A0C5VV04_9GAMM|nr:signal peptidase II [Gynuella sunshinyii]AJQ94214.1 lipoprotein signal peptidase [Gynuella sunshinyii YC6258]